MRIAAIFSRTSCICSGCGTVAVAEGGQETIKELSAQSGVNCPARWSKYNTTQIQIQYKPNTTQYNTNENTLPLTTINTHAQNHNTNTKHTTTQS